MNQTKNKIAVICLGTELTQGFTLNTNAHWISGRLRELGFDTAFRVTLPDSAEAWDAAWEMIRSAGITAAIIGGGLGPTSDDKTRGLVAKTCGLKLVYHPECEEHIKDWFAGRGKPYVKMNRVQAYIPESAAVLDNPVGTAPGFRVTKDGITLFTIPGVPSEAKVMFDRHIAPWLHSLGAPRLYTRETRLSGISEARLEEIIRTVDFGKTSWSSLPVKDAIVFRIYTHESGELLGKVQAAFEKALGDESVIVSRDGKNMVQVIMDLLRAKGEKMTSAESCTGGLIASEMVSEAGSSDVFEGGIVAYQNEIKRTLLHVPESILNKYGAVSEPVVRAMAEGASEAFGCPWAVATSGVAGPGGGTSETPVGLVWMAVKTPYGTFAESEIFPGDRTQVREKSAYRVLNQLRLAILNKKALAL